MGRRAQCGARHSLLCSSGCGPLGTSHHPPVVPEHRRVPGTGDGCERAIRIALVGFTSSGQVPPLQMETVIVFAPNIVKIK